jgi:hypothetical protein
LSSEIFEKAGFDLSIIGNRRSSSSLARWKAAYQEKGIMGL